MKRLLRLSALGIALFLSAPSASNAFWNNPQNNHGMGWWEGRALRWNAWIHFEGPLYSYGPYYGQGYAYMNVPQPFVGSYHPAYPAAYYGVPNPYATINGFHSWNGTATQLGYPNALTIAPSDFFTNEVLKKPAAPATTTSNYYGGDAPGYFQQPRPNPIR